jgi:carbon-monoxide dehydrogenase large subunit
VLTGSPEQGTGTYTVIQRVAAQSLSIDPAHIVVTHVDTSDAEPDAGVGGSRAANVYGNATFESATALKSKLEELASEVLGWPAGEARIDADAFSDASGQSASFLEVAQRIARGAPVETNGSYASPPHAEVSSENFCAYAIEVELDRETGGIRLCDVVFVADVGTIFNPVAHEGQLHGGFLYGLGSALTEELQIQDGRVTTLTLGEYKLPAAADVPPLRVVLLPPQSGPGELGGKSAGELTNTTVPAAIANAVADAGARVLELPITAERILAVLTRETDSA